MWNFYFNLLKAAPQTPSPSTTPAHINCDRDIYLNTTSDMGTISSPNFGGGRHYPANAGCVWRIFAPYGNVVRLHYNAFKLEPSRGCTFDAVNIFDGPSSTGQRIAKHCGNVGPPDDLSKSNVMYVSFVTDDDTQATGFNATYSVEPIPGRRCYLYCQIP